MKIVCNILFFCENKDEKFKIHLTFITGKCSFSLSYPMQSLVPFFEALMKKIMPHLTLRRSWADLEEKLQTD